MSEHVDTDPPRSRPHCTTCTCTTEDMGEFTIYPPHERFYGRCERCGEVRWKVEYDKFVDHRPVRTTHCGCCTHRHNLPNGGHDARCLADPRHCTLLHLDGRPVFTSVQYPGRL